MSLLVEYQDIFGQLDDVLAEAAAGESLLAVVDGARAPDTKSALWALGRRAAQAGATVLDVTGSPGEQHVPYAMLGRLRHSLGAIGATVDAAVVEGAPVLVAIADVEFADVESLRGLPRLAEAVPGRPLVFVLGGDPLPGRATSAALRELIDGPQVRRIRLETQLREGVESVRAARFEPVGRTHPAAIRHTPAGGRPASVETIPDAAAGASARTGLRQAIAGCLHRMGLPATRVVQGVAVLGEAADIGLLSRLCGIDPKTSRHLVRELNAAGVLHGTRFRHEEIRSAVLDELPVDEAAFQRHRAARLLYESGARSHTVANLLMAAGPLPEEWALSALQDAARQVPAHRRSTLAVEYLRFAGECCLDPSRRYALKIRIAELLRLVDPAAADARFLALKGPILAGKVAPDEALRVADALLWSLRSADAVEIVAHVAAGHDVARLGEAWQLTRLRVAAGSPGLASVLGLTAPAPRSGDPAAVEGPRSAELRAAEALTAALGQRVDRDVMAQAEQVLREESRGGGGSFEAVADAILALVHADLIDSAAAWCERLVAEARDEPVRTAWLGSLGALVALRKGQLDSAIEQAESFLAFMSGHGWNAQVGLALATLVEAHTATGNHAAAAECLGRPVHPALFETRSGLHYLYARGIHHLAADRPHAALADFTACGERMALWHIDTPALVPWRLGAARGWLRLGRRDRAAALAEEQAAGLGPELPRAYGLTLRCLAATMPVDARLPLLEKALGMLQIGNDRYESAGVLADLSETYQALGNDTHARTAARRARRIAKICHGEEPVAATPPAQVPTAEPGEAQRADRDDQFARLSESERRVAVLAAAGYSNREIAGRIYVTVSTVEQHLTRVYRKLGIRRREELPMDIRVYAADTA
ncbi:helix-turn-helix transcriptional regulator [Embleya scabrispora]|uniref:Putative LuxR-family transcriptional regulator n=1 Tax=Embleya scabrispora TaxID=159449 RepID=A0A0F7R6Z1_9ACTN|nr:helix-turn-helix transcriptional regulator [Embleya scabrispora]MYS86801.1 helix-turn-helix transcriptional regulator [Streptomyces sp. SID5474]BAR73024.1 putative LuxR-family transcriptional regulator [Embleya scabrispora]